MDIESLVSRLEKVRGRAGNYVACCPAHKDRNPSMTVRQTPEGKILMHCFAGCSVQQIAESIGISLSDLFPEDMSRDKTYAPARPVRPKFLAHDLLRVIAHEATIVAVCAHDMAKGRALSDADSQRLLVAARRINEALEYNQ